jgi:ribonuclease E
VQPDSIQPLREEEEQDLEPMDVGEADVAEATEDVERRPESGERREHAEREDAGGRRRRRRRRRGRGGEALANGRPEPMATREPGSAGGGDEELAVSEHRTQSEEYEGDAGHRRRRGRRGGRRGRRGRPGDQRLGTDNRLIEEPGPGDQEQRPFGYAAYNGDLDEIDTTPQPEPRSARQATSVIDRPSEEQALGPRESSGEHSYSERGDRQRGEGMPSERSTALADERPPARPDAEEEEEDDPNRPKRSGWWQRRTFF